MNSIRKRHWLLFGALLVGASAIAQEQNQAEQQPEVFETDSGAKVYRQVGPDGEVMYSDKPLSEQAEPVEVPKSPTYEARPAPRFQAYEDDTPGQQEPAETYKRVEVTYPQPDQVIRDNTGNLRVSVAVEPSLQQGHQLQLLFNGEVRYTGRSTTVSLSEVWRNTYNIVPRIVTGQGETVATGEGVTFHMKQHSRNF